MINNFNKSYSRYYDLLYKEKDYEAEAAYVLSVAKRFKKEIYNAIELGSGTAGHAEFLCKAGLKITGIEISQEMVNQALSKKIPGFDVIQMDITDFLVEAKFDLAISLFHVISYLNDNESLINCFRQVNAHLHENGIFIFDTWYSPAVYVQKPIIKIKRLNDKEVTITRIAEPTSFYNQNVVEVMFEVLIAKNKTKLQTIVKEKHRMRHFSIPEIELLASLTGFKVINVEEFLSSETPSENTWGVCFTLQKQAS